MQVATNVDATRDSEQRRQQNHEGNVLGHQGVHQTAGRRAHAKDGCKRQQKRQRPASGHLTEMVVPEMRQEQWHQRNRQQNARERNAPCHRQIRPVETRRRRQPGYSRPDGYRRTAPPAPQACALSHTELLVSVFIKIIAGSACRTRAEG
ncbi:hypothetical protein D3C72_1862150 [compost metagenome]